MDFNELIEKEIESRVIERTKEIQNTYNLRLEEFKKRLVDNFVQKVYSNFFNSVELYKEEFLKENTIQITKTIDKSNNIKNLEKCDYTTCKNFKDGSLDDICKNCDSRNTDSIKSKIKNTIEKKSNEQELNDNIKAILNILGISDKDFKNVNFKVLNKNADLKDTFNKILDQLNKDFYL